MILSILKEQKFLNFFFSDLISGFGVGMATIGVNWFLFAETSSNEAVGMMLTVNVLASFLVTPIIGTIIDNMERKKVIVATHFFRVIFITMIVLYLKIVGFNLIVVYFFSIINGIGWSTYMAASKSFIQEILNEENLIRGNSLIEISMQVGMFMAGAASGIIYKYFGFETILFVSIITYAISGILVFSIKHVTPPIKHHKDSSFISLYRQGISYLWKRKILFFIGFFSIIPLVVIMLFNVILPGYVSVTLGQDSISFGMADMLVGVGGLVSGILLGTSSNKINKNFILIGSFFVGSINLYVLFLGKSLLILFIGSFLFGLTNSLLRIELNSILMKKIEPQFMGRSMAVWTGISLLLQAIGYICLGKIGDTIGAEYGFLILGGIIMFGLFGIVVLVLTKKSYFSD